MATKYECDRCKRIETDKENDDGDKGWGTQGDGSINDDDDGDRSDDWDLCPPCYRSLKKWQQRKN